jgi:hypothetical protein
MRIVPAPARACLAAASASVAAVLGLPAAASAGPDDPPAASVTAPQLVRVGPGSAAPKPVTVQVSNAGMTATGIVVTIDGTAAPGGVALSLPGAELGCAVEGPVARCAVAELAFGRTREFTFGVLVPQAGAEPAEGVVTVRTAAADGGFTAEQPIAIAVTAANVDLAVAPIPNYSDVRPGQALEVPLRVRNDGGVVADGVVVRIRANGEEPYTRLVELPNDYANCTVAADLHDMTCLFDVVLSSGEAFETDPATPLRARVDAASPGRESYGASVQVRAATAADRLTARRSAPGRDARLVAVSGVRAPDLNQYDNGAYISMTVPDLQPADGVALPTRVRGETGEELTVRVAFRNDGPAAISAREGSGVRARVRLPAGLRVRAVPGACRPTGDPDEGPGGAVRGRDYTCVLGRWQRPGVVETLPFEVTITGRAGARGSLTLDRNAQDRTPANDRAPITLVVEAAGGGAGDGGGDGGGGGGGLPITGPSAWLGLLLLAGGCALLRLARRVTPCCQDGSRL